MAPLPHTSSRVLVALVSVVVALGATLLTGTASSVPADPRSWPGTVVSRLRADVAERGPAARAWAVVAAWSLAVTVLHVGGLAVDAYTRVPWWDFVTHLMGGAGVAAVLWLGLRDRQPARRIPWWIVGVVVAVGAGFELYEFVFKRFWWDWSLRLYVVDTAVDLVVNAMGAAGFVLARAAARGALTGRHPGTGAGAGAGASRDHEAYAEGRLDGRDS
jgi:hypothetical protein